MGTAQLLRVRKIIKLIDFQKKKHKKGNHLLF